jgi:hypothetical protein
VSPEWGPQGSWHFHESPGVRNKGTRR